MNKEELRLIEHALKDINAKIENKSEFMPDDIINIHHELLFFISKYIISKIEEDLEDLEISERKSAREEVDCSNYDKMD